MGKPNYAAGIALEAAKVYPRVRDFDTSGGFGLRVKTLYDSGKLTDSVQELAIAGLASAYREDPRLNDVPIEVLRVVARMKFSQALDTVVEVSEPLRNIRANASPRERPSIH